MFNDKPLVQRAQKGDRSALSALYEAYQPPIYRYIYYRTGDTALSEDLTAEVFVSMVKHIRTYEERGRPFLAWLYTIAGNALKMHHRNRLTTDWLPLSTEMVDDGPGPAEATQMRLTQDRLIAALPYLTELQQQVILLKFVEGFSNAEIGAVLGKTEGSVKSCQHRALAALRRVLVEELRYEPS